MTVAPSTLRLGLAGLVLYLAVAGLASVLAGAEDEAEVVARALNIRGGPGTRYEIVKTVHRGEMLPIEDVVGKWARLKWDRVAWVLVRYVKLPERFLVDGFVEKEDAFLGWAGANDALEELVIRGRGVLWVVLAPHAYESEEDVRALASRLACGYRERTGFDGRVIATVWPESGPGTAWVTRETCG